MFTYKSRRPAATTPWGGGWKVGSGQLCLPTLTHSKVGWLGLPRPQGNQGYRGAASKSHSLLKASFLS